MATSSAFSPSSSSSNNNMSNSHKRQRQHQRRSAGASNEDHEEVVNQDKRQRKDNDDDESTTDEQSDDEDGDKSNEVDANEQEDPDDRGDDKVSEEDQDNEEDREEEEEKKEEEREKQQKKKKKSSDAEKKWKQKRKEVSDYYLKNYPSKCDLSEEEYIIQTIFQRFYSSQDLNKRDCLEFSEYRIIIERLSQVCSQTPKVLAEVKELQTHLRKHLKHYQVVNAALIKYYDQKKKALENTNYDMNDNPDYVDIDSFSLMPDTLSFQQVTSLLLEILRYFVPSVPLIRALNMTSDESEVMHTEYRNSKFWKSEYELYQRNLFLFASILDSQTAMAEELESKRKSKANFESKRSRKISLKNKNNKSGKGGGAGHNAKMFKIYNGDIYKVWQEDPEEFLKVWDKFKKFIFELKIQSEMDLPKPSSMMNKIKSTNKSGRGTKTKTKAASINDVDGLDLGTLDRKQREKLLAKLKKLNEEKDQEKKHEEKDYAKENDEDDDRVDKTDSSSSKSRSTSTSTSSTSSICSSSTLSSSISNSDIDSSRNENEASQEY